MSDSQAVYRAMAIAKEAVDDLRKIQTYLDTINEGCGDQPVIDWTDTLGQEIEDAVEWLESRLAELFGTLALRPGASTMVGEVDPDTHRRLEHEG